MAAESVNAAKYPLTARYLSGLPAGLASHPGVRCKASVVRTLASDLAFHPVRGALPDALIDILENPPPVTGWIDETELVALSLAVRDECFRTDIAWLDWRRRVNVKLLGAGMYQAVASGVTTASVLKNFGDRWRMFHTGTTATGSLLDATSASVVFAFPAGLYPELYVRSLASTIEACAEVAGGRNPRAECVESTRERGRIVCRWS